MSERYRVPKHKIRVRIRTSAHEEETVFLFLSECAEGHAGSERPVDLFRGRGEFLVVETEEGQVVFLRRGSLSLVALALEDELGEGLAGGDPVAADLDTEAAIRVVLEDGIVLEGVTRYQLPEAQARLQDFINSDDAFLPLYQADEIILVNKARISRVTLL